MLTAYDLAPNGFLRRCFGPTSSSIQILDPFKQGSELTLACTRKAILLPRETPSLNRFLKGSGFRPRVLGNSFSIWRKITFPLWV